MTSINLILTISLICNFILPVLTIQSANRQGNKRLGSDKRRPEQLRISTSFDLTMAKASLKDLSDFLGDIARGVLEPDTANIKGKAYGLRWTSSRADQTIILNITILDKFASLIRSVTGPRHRLPLNSQVLKDSKHTQRPVLQTIIDFIEEQINQHYSRKIGQFMVKQTANFANLYFSSAAQVISTGLLTLSSLLDGKE
ncbi:uncharacterized protein LOC107366730 [Tetranychus urticae]|uniref:Uncharacterized protein n=1 Tax=Tetranychus urticae TaxID=32264 RepID=T1KS89_TETUR|nr:uncharacterized protein LOC107366730 [Tetranychus urticae]